MKKYFNIFKIFTNKTNAKFSLGVCSVVLSSSVCFAAVQATSKDGKIFYISEHSFKDNQVYDPQAEIFKKINGKNFYASKSKYPISNLTMIYNNPKSGNKNLSKLEILTPDTSKEEIITAFSTLGTVSSDTQAVPSSFIPFIVTAYAQNTNATNSKLILENGELSSVYFCKPSIGDCGVPNNSQKGDRFKYLITAAFTDRRGGGGFNNQTILKENSYINNGCRKYLHLALKWSSLYFRICSF
ncbi:TPA: hypothetical protein SG084_000981 [Campylobacter jejuni]|nr:hypothetical protein [Campylobacter jejuni]HEH4076912.1 hypothetical protein [Campylobacter jejuni]